MTWFLLKKKAQGQLYLNFTSHSSKTTKKPEVPELQKNNLNLPEM
jgi:hypothetical protein